MSADAVGTMPNERSTTRCSSPGPRSRRSRFRSPPKAAAPSHAEKHLPGRRRRGRHYAATSQRSFRSRTISCSWSGNHLPTALDADTSKCCPPPRVTLPTSYTVGAPPHRQRPVGASDGQPHITGDFRCLRGGSDDQHIHQPVPRCSSFCWRAGEATGRTWITSTGSFLQEPCRTDESSLSRCAAQLPDGSIDPADAVLSRLSDDHQRTRRRRRLRTEYSTSACRTPGSSHRRS